RAIDDVEQLRDEFGTRAPDPEELREPQVDVGERRTVDLRRRRQVAPGPERVDRIQVERAAAGSRQDTRRQIAGQRVIVQVARGARGAEWQTRSEVADRRE